MASKVLKLLKNRYAQLTVAFVLGGAAAMFLTPEKIVIEKKGETKYVDRIVEKEVVKWKEKVVEKEVEKLVKVKKVWQKTTFPDGKIIESEIYESESEQIERIKEQEEEKYAQLLAEKTQELEEKYSYLKEHMNPKRINLYAGIGTQVDDFLSERYFVGGFNYTLWGPFGLGAEVTTEKQFAITFNLRF